MATAVHVLPASAPPNPEVLAPVPNSVEEIDRELRRAATAYRKTLARLAFYSFRLYLCEGWVTFGYPAGAAGENLYREEVLRVPASSYRKARRIGQALHQLSLEEIEQIQPSNLELLLEVPSAIQHDFPWAKEATHLRPKKLAELITERSRLAGEQREPLTSYAVRIPYLAKQAIETMVEGFQKKHGLSSPGQALEMLVADRHDRPSLLGACNQARLLIDGVLKACANGRVTEETRGWLVLAKELLDEASKEEIQAARQASEGDEGDFGGRGSVPAERRREGGEESPVAAGVGAPGGTLLALRRPAAVV